MRWPCIYDNMAIGYDKVIMVIIFSTNYMNFHELQTLRHHFDFGP